MVNLYTFDVCSAFYGSDRKPVIVGGEIWSGSKDTTPADILGVYANLEKDTPKDHFTIAINDDVTGLSLEKGPTIDVTPEGTTSCLFWVLVLMVLLVLTRTLSRLSVTIQICMLRLTSLMTLRSLVVSQILT